MLDFTRENVVKAYEKATKKDVDTDTLTAVLLSIFVADKVADENGYEIDWDGVMKELKNG